MDLVVLECQSVRAKDQKSVRLDECKIEKVQVWKSVYSIGRVELEECKIERMQDWKSVGFEECRIGRVQDQRVAVLKCVILWITSDL